MRAAPSAKAAGRIARGRRDHDRGPAAYSFELGEEVRALGLLSPQEQTIVLLSGGRDSVCLLDLTVQIVGAENVHALHLNYGLRPTADKDEELCESLAHKLGVELTVKRVARAASSDRGNLLAWARAERYRAADELAQTYERGGKPAVIASAHTATDQAETILYRLVSSPGRRALLGMSLREGRLVRPLLHFDREQVTEYCRQVGLDWRDDPTNENVDFARNRLRREVFPLLNSVNTNAQSNILKTATTLREEAELLDLLVDRVLTELGDRPALSKLQELPDALTRLVIQRMVDALVEREPVSVASQVDAILTLEGSGGSASLDIGGGIRAVVEYGQLYFDLNISGQRERGEQQVNPLVELPLPGTVEFAAGAITSGIEIDVDGERTMAVLARVNVPAEQTPVNPDVALLDLDTLKFPLKVRRWEHGDRMRPLGLGGSKSLHDLFVDRKVPRIRRQQLPVVLSASEIVWIPGVAVGDRFQITPGTRGLVRLQWEEHGNIS